MKKDISNVVKDVNKREETFLSILRNENGKNPLTDQRIADMMGTSRDVVLGLRRKFDVDDSRERRKDALRNVIQEILRLNKGISQRGITEALRRKGFHISRFATAQILGEITNGVESKFKADFSLPMNKPINRDEDIFTQLIGHEDSLKTAIIQAKSAILYPPMGLHTLIVGDTGVGKSQLAEAMYQYAIDINKISPNKPFIRFNCADYADNPQLILSQLFGYKKGAFTGADQEKQGLIDHADNSILFLDEIHRLPPEGQEILFDVIDRGTYKRLGETESTRTVSTMVVAATTENAESSLLLTFRRRIPVTINLPGLEARSLKERLELIKLFFMKESRRTRTSVVVHVETVWALLLYDCKGNIGQLKSDIQVSCARAFLSYVIEKSNYMQITLSDIPNHARRGLLRIQENRKEIETLITGNLKIDYSKSQIINLHVEDVNKMPDDIYSLIENRYNNLIKHELSSEVVNKVIGEEIEGYVSDLVKSVEKKFNSLDVNYLKNIVGHRIVQMTEEIIKISEECTRKKFDEKYFFSLAVHLNASIDRLRQGKIIYNPQLETIKNKYIEEFIVAQKICKYIYEKYSIGFPQDEVGFLALYIMMNNRNPYEREKHVGIVVVSHGHIASNMLDVAKKLLGSDHGVAVEMALTESPDIALNRTADVVKEVHDGKGVLLLVDMGSLITFGEIITDTTGIPTKTISRADVITVIEAIRRAVLPGETLDNLHRILLEERIEIRSLDNAIMKKRFRDPVILSVCVTGEGTAHKIKDILLSLVPGIESNCEIIPVGLLNSGHTTDELNRLKRDYDVIATIGSFDVFNGSIPFFPIEELLSGSALEGLKRIFKTAGIEIDCNCKSPMPQLIDMFEDDLISLNVKFDSSEEIIKYLGNKLYKSNRVTSDFVREVILRENIGSTEVESGVSMPHADSRFTIKPSIAIATLDNPIKWKRHHVHAVFLLAINEECLGALQQLINIISNKELVERLQNVHSIAVLKEVLFNVIR